MTNVSQLLFENQLKERLHAKKPDTVPYFVQHDPLQRFAHWWNDVMPDMHCDYTERAYLQPQAVMTAKIAADEITDLPHFLQTFSAVLVMTGLHFRTLSYHKLNPRLRRGKTSVDGEQDSLPLFVALNDIHRFISREPDPADSAARRQDLRAALQKARQLKRLPLAVYRRILAFEFERGTAYGAVPHVASMAVTNPANGRIVTFRRSPWAEPTESTLRQVRRLHRTALEAIQRIDTETPQ